MNTILWIIAAGLVLGCLFVHRRVCMAIFKGEKLPVAPRWHVWLKHRRK